VIVRFCLAVFIYLPDITRSVGTAFLVKLRIELLASGATRVNALKGMVLLPALRCPADFFVLCAIRSNNFKCLTSAVLHLQRFSHNFQMKIVFWASC